ncbi:uncharacterized protein LOC112574444 isoform X1 [Pomacea canaliculata]|uniref:uncharacterized protein LOC112574444 isoform X1 n=3 Tax=Pomacea canaliculata TaxID=400727 RepID=UPI000D738289|nr:uncharacterized protein LOC112574444 isoform X1 [Pomacea canaliculata]
MQKDVEGETNIRRMAAPRGNSRPVAGVRRTRRTPEESRSSLQQLLKEINKGGRADVTEISRLLDSGDLGPLHDLRDPGQVPILNVAIKSRSNSAARVLLKRGVNPMLTDLQGHTALHAAAIHDNYQLLVDMMQGCDVNVQDDNGQTPLHIAARNTCAETCNWLVFLGANPNIPTRIGQTAKELTTWNVIHQILREYSPGRSPVTTATLSVGSPFVADDLQFSLQLLPQSNIRSAKLFYRVCTEISANLRTEDEEVWGPMAEYRLLQQLRVHLVYPLHEELEKFYELVLRMVSAGGRRRDLTLEVKKLRSAQAAQTSPRQDKDSGVEDEEPVADVVEGHVDAELDVAGAILLVYRPTQQQVELGESCRKIESAVSNGITLGVNEVFKGKVKGQLQIEPSVPVKDTKALTGAAVVEDSEVQSQTGYHKFQMDQKDITPDVERNLHLTVPSPQGYTGGNLTVWSRMMSVDSTSGSESEVDNDEREAGRWRKVEVVKLPREAKCFRLPVAINQTMTAMEVTKNVPEEKLRRRVAKQYKMRKNKPVVFFVASRPWPGWRECQELLMVVTSPAHLSNQLRKHLVGGFMALQLSGELFVPKVTSFLISVVGDVLIEHGDREAVLSYRYGMKWPSTSGGDFCKFVLRGRQEVRVREGGFSISKKIKGRKGQDQVWKDMGVLRFSLSTERQSLIGTGTKPENKMAPFTDVLLMDIASKVLASEAQQLGIRMGLTRSEVDAIVSDERTRSPVFRTFEMLARVRGKCPTLVDFGTRLVSALVSMEWTDIVEWLLNQGEIRRWSGFDELNVTKQK